MTKRWPDAKSLREALLPSDEESDESLPARLLRISATLGSLAVLAFVYLSNLFAINPDFKFVPRAIATIVVAVMAMVMAGVATIRLRSYGLDGRSILTQGPPAAALVAIVVPARPSTARRRLESPSARTPALSTLSRCVPDLHVRGLRTVAVDSGRLPTVLWAVSWATWFVGGLWLLAERRRATTFVRAKVAITAAEASAILTTSTFGVPTWRRAPISSLLDGQGRVSPRAIDGPSAEGQEHFGTPDPLVIRLIQSGYPFTRRSVK